MRCVVIDEARAVAELRAALEAYDRLMYELGAVAGTTRVEADELGGRLRAALAALGG